MFDDLSAPFALAAALAFFVLYFLPAVLAFWRDAENRWLVLVVNVLFGASVLGWFFALYLLVMLPATSHIGISGETTVLAPMVSAFLDDVMPTTPELF